MKLRLRQGVPGEYGWYFDIDLKLDTSTKGPGWFEWMSEDPWETVRGMVEEEAIYKNGLVYYPEDGEWRST